MLAQNRCPVCHSANINLAYNENSGLQHGVVYLCVFGCVWVLACVGVGRWSGHAAHPNLAGTTPCDVVLKRQAVSELRVERLWRAGSR